MSNHATSLDVARLAGVSQSAVSRVFTPGASASSETAAKVRAAAESLDYRPNALARGLITGRSRMIGLIVAHLDNQFYSVALELLSRSLQEHGYHVLVFMAGNAAAEVEPVVRELLDYRVDAIITASVAVSNHITARCDAAGIPVVMFNRGQADPRLSEVVTDNRAGGRMVADHLARTGHRRIAHISGWMGSTTGRERASGLEEGLAAHGLEVAAREDGEYDRGVAAEIVRRMFGASERPDAVFVGNDHMAFSVMDTLRHELGLRVPDDVSVVGYDDVPIAAWPTYDLTTVRQPVNRMVEATVRALLTRIERTDAAPAKIRVPGNLIERGSTRRPGSG